MFSDIWCRKYVKSIYINKYDSLYVYEVQCRKKFSSHLEIL